MFLVIFGCYGVLNTEEERGIPSAGVTEFLETSGTAETQTHLAIYRKGCCHISSPRSYSDYYLLVFR